MPSPWLLVDNAALAHWSKCFQLLRGCWEENFPFYFRKYNLLVFKLREKGSGALLTEQHTGNGSLNVHNVFIWWLQSTQQNDVWFAGRERISHRMPNTCGVEQSCSSRHGNESILHRILKEWELWWSKSRISSAQYACVCTHWHINAWFV